MRYYCAMVLLTALHMALYMVSMFILALALLGTFHILGIDIDSLRSEKPQKEVSMKELLSVSIDLATRGGVEVKHVAETNDFQKMVKSKTLEGAKEFMTNGDRNSHSKIIYGFNKAFPELMSKIISEEKDTRPFNLAQVLEPNKGLPEVTKRIKDDQKVKVSDIDIWVDPLDATQEYTELLHQYVTVMICVAVRGQPTIGVVHYPFTQTTVWGWFGYGNNLKVDEKANSNSEGKDKSLKVIVSRSHTGDSKSYIQSALGEKTEIIPAGGAGYKTLQVANKTVDAYVHFTKIKKWDICAGHAILQSVGGTMKTMEGHAIDYSISGAVENNEGLIATLKGHEDIRPQLQQAFKRFKEDVDKKDKTKENDVKGSH